MIKVILCVLLTAGTSFAARIEGESVLGQGLIGDNLAIRGPILSEHHVTKLEGSKLVVTKFSQMEMAEKIQIGKSVKTVVTTGALEQATSYPLMFTIPKKLVLPTTIKEEVREPIKALPTTKETMDTPIQTGNTDVIIGSVAGLAALGVGSYLALKDKGTA